MGTVPCNLSVEELKKDYLNGVYGCCIKCGHDFGEHRRESSSSSSDEEDTVKTYIPTNLYKQITQLVDSDREWIKNQDNELIQCNICCVRIKNSVTNCGHTCCAGCLISTWKDNKVQCAICREYVKSVGPFYI